MARVLDRLTRAGLLRAVEALLCLEWLVDDVYRWAAPNRPRNTGHGLRCSMRPGSDATQCAQVALFLLRPHYNVHNVHLGV